MNISISNIGFHRNGIAGAPFYAVVFREMVPEATLKLGIVFEAPSHVAIFDIAKLADGDIQFGTNSWRGDHYEPPLRLAIQKHVAA